MLLKWEEHANELAGKGPARNGRRLPQGATRNRRGAASGGGRRNMPQQKEAEPASAPLSSRLKLRHSGSKGSRGERGHK